MPQNWGKQSLFSVTKGKLSNLETTLCLTQAGRDWETYSDGAKLSCNPRQSSLQHAPPAPAACVPASCSTRTDQ